MSKPVIQEIFESELARLRAKHHVHDAARIIIDAGPYFDPSQRAAYGSIVEALGEIEKQLAELEKAFP